MCVVFVCFCCFLLFVCSLFVFLSLVSPLFTLLCDFLVFVILLYSWSFLFVVFLLLSLMEINMIMSWLPVFLVAWLECYLVKWFEC